MNSCGICLERAGGRDRVVSGNGKSTEGIFFLETNKMPSAIINYYFVITSPALLPEPALWISAERPASRQSACQGARPQPGGQNPASALGSPCHLFWAGRAPVLAFPPGSPAPRVQPPSFAWHGPGAGRKVCALGAPALTSVPSAPLARASPSLAGSRRAGHPCMQLA